MNTTIYVSRAALAACLPAVGVRDVRYYLNGVRLTRAADGAGVVAVATDGHRVHAVFDVHGQWAGPLDRGVILPTDAVKRAIKGKCGAVVVTVAEDDAGDALTITGADTAIFQARGVQWRALDIAQALPSACVMSRLDGMTNPAFLADMMEAAGVVTKGDRSPGAGVATDLDGRVFVQASGIATGLDYVGLAMPLRDTGAWLGDGEGLTDEARKARGGDSLAVGVMPILARVRRALGG
jgi:ribosomal protein S5